MTDGPYVRAEPAGGDAWQYDVCVGGVWSGPMLRRDAQALLLEQGDSANLATRRLGMARRQWRSRAAEGPGS